MDAPLPSGRSRRQSAGDHDKLPRAFRTCHSPAGDARGRAWRAEGTRFPAPASVPHDRLGTHPTGGGHYDKDRPAIIAWISRQGGVIVQATRDFTVKTVQKAAGIAVQVSSRLYTDSASSYRALKGYVHAFVNHTQKEYARGDVHENRAECLFSLLKPYLRVFRGLSKTNLPGYVGFFQFLRNFRQQNAFEQAELILRAALDPTIARKARRGEFVKCIDHFDLLQIAIN